MKIWKFYRKQTDKEIRDSLNAGAKTADIHPLLAFTNDKSIRDEFVSQRDMSQYIEKVTKGVDTDDWKIYANDPERRGRLLQYFSLNTKYIDDAGVICDTKDDGADKSKALSILSTGSEILELEGVCDNLSDCQFYGFIGDKINWPCIWIFKHKIQKSLFNLGYETAWKLNTQEGSPQRCEEIQPEGYDPDSDWTEFAPDELAVFTTQMIDWFKK